MRRNFFRQTPLVCAKAQAKRLNIYVILGMSILMLCLLVTQTASARLSQPGATTGVDEALSHVGFQHVAAQIDFKKGLLAFKRSHYYRAERLWLPLAQSGHRDAQFYMGVLYDSIEDAAQYSHKATFWYQKAAGNGHSDAQHNLGLAYARGQGVKVDMQLAVRWWHAAAQQGNSDSQYNLGIVFATGARGIKQDLSKAKQWWLLAASGGDPMAQYNLGALYANGVDGQQNYCEAAHWWMLSEGNGFSQAHVALENLGRLVDVNTCR